jgi:transketolase
MGADNTPAQTVEAPALKAIDLKSRLADTPAGDPQYFVELKTADGKPVKVADPRATRAVVACMNVHAVVGGAACHWGGPAALAEVNAALHAIMFEESKAQGKPWHALYNYVNDAGHTENGVYALRSLYGFDGTTFADMKKFRSIESKHTGHGEAHLNPEGVLISNGPLGSSLPQAQGLAMGDKAAGRDRVTVCVVSDGASYEGEAKEAFAAIPGFAEKGLVNPFVMVISDNNTKLSGRCTDAFSMQNTFEALEAQGWKVIKVKDGNNLAKVYSKMEKAIAKAKADPTQPVFVWLKTVKGYGIKETEKSSSGGHGFPLKNGEHIVDWLKEIFEGDEVPADLMQWAEELHADWKQSEEAKKNAPAQAEGPKKSKIQAGLSKAMIAAAQEGIPVFSVSSDLAGSTGTAPFVKSLPDRSIDVGVAEANMISTAAGLSNTGYIPVVDTFAQFGITKGNLPLTMAALSQSPVIAVFSHVGFQDAADGASHQATTYMAATSPIPHTVVINLSCADEAEAFMGQAIRRMHEARQSGKAGESVLFFLGRENYPLSWKPGTSYEWGKAQILREGSDVTFLTCGSLVGKALEAADKLEAQGKSATVINNPFINRVDVASIQAAVAKTGNKLVTVEDHQIICGMGSQVVTALVTAGTPLQARILGIDGEFGQSAYMADHLYDRHGLNADGLIKAYQELG